MCKSGDVPCILLHLYRLEVARPGSKVDRQSLAGLSLQANAIINEHAKRLKQAEHQAADLQKRCDELNSDLQSSNSENQRLAAELTRLKTSVNDQQAKIDSLTRDNNKLTGQTLLIRYVVTTGDYNRLW